VSDREDDLGATSDETIAFSGRSGRPPPGATQPLYVDSLPPPPRGRQTLIAVLIFLLGLGVGFVVAQFVGRSDSRVPDPNLVLYENASMSFPIEGAQFTRSTYDPDQKTCNAELLKQFLRSDERRFNAWLEVQAITADEFDAFVDRLETQILTKVTPVTNFGCFAEGDGPCPFSIQSVLGVGTPVWFDPVQQRIVAKCTCSNPLKAPRCPPNCEEIPTPTPSPSPSPSPTPTRSPTPPPTQPPRTAPPTPTPTEPPPPTFPPLTESPRPT
jgi:hypothetical protein